MLKMISRLVRDEEGQGLAEYALILVLIAVAVVTALGLLGDEINTIFESITDSLQDTPDPE